mmetsp:Transcript_6289/g.19195  ORF Transcript_6289/g.19195 Transcript_6289/m.19195 type:complete len:134 (-) Transcript_6289:444-845(-)
MNPMLVMNTTPPLRRVQRNHSVTSTGVCLCSLGNEHMQLSHLHQPIALAMRFHLSARRGVMLLLAAHARPMRSWLNKASLESVVSLSNTISAVGMSRRHREGWVCPSSGSCSRALRATNAAGAENGGLDKTCG